MMTNHDRNRQLPGQGVTAGGSTSAPVTVRVMRPEEYPDVRALSIAAFGDEPSLGELLDALHGSWAWRGALSFVAEHNSVLVGHCLLTRALLDAPGRLVDVLVLGPVGVLPNLQRAGIGGQLIRHALSVAAGRGEVMVLLEGLPDYYPRFGFRPATDVGVRAPSLRIPAAAFQALALPAHERWMTGTLVYPDAVWHLDAVGERPEDPRPGTDLDVDPDTVGVRTATIDDIDAVLALAVTFYAEDGFTTSADQLRANLAAMLTECDPRRRIALVAHADQIVGFAITMAAFGLEAGWYAELEDLYVAPPARGTQLGEALVKDSAAWARQQECAHLEVVIAAHGSDVTGLEGWYDRQGLAATGRVIRSLPLTRPVAL